MENDAQALDAELTYRPLSREERDRRPRWFFFPGAQTAVPPGYYPLQLLRLVFVGGALALIMPLAIASTAGMASSDLIHPSICSWSIGALASFVGGHVVGTQAWKLVGPGVRGAARRFVVALQAALPWMILGLLLIIGLSVLVLRLRSR